MGRGRHDRYRRRGGAQRHLVWAKRKRLNLGRSRWIKPIEVESLVSGVASTGITRTIARLNRGKIWQTSHRVSGYIHSSPSTLRIVAIRLVDSWQIKVSITISAIASLPIAPVAAATLYHPPSRMIIEALSGTVGGGNIALFIPHVIASRLIVVTNRVARVVIVSCAWRVSRNVPIGITRICRRWVILPCAGPPRRSCIVAEHVPRQHRQRVAHQPHHEEIRKAVKGIPRNSRNLILVEPEAPQAAPQPRKRRVCNLSQAVGGQVDAIQPRAGAEQPRPHALIPNLV
jgi:hypothetical protein